MATFFGIDLTSLLDAATYPSAKFQSIQVPKIYWRGINADRYTYMPDKGDVRLWTQLEAFL